MPVHDWSRVSAGIFHDFHLAWIAELLRALNGGLLPSSCYAQAERRTADFSQDRLDGRRGPADDGTQSVLPKNEGRGTSVAVVPPITSIIGEVDEASLYALKCRTLTIRHATNNRIVALLEIASPGNKGRPQSVQRFVDKAVAALQSGYHLIVIDLLPPRASDPAGLTSAVWEEFGGRRIDWPAGKPLSAASFRVADRIQCYAEPFAPGEPIPELPLFYDPDWYVNLPLDATYAAAYEGVPRRWKQVIEKTGEPTD